MTSAPSQKRRVAILGATGAVGQAFIRLLADHPWFEIAALAASERSAGKRYAEAARWVGDDAPPAGVAGMPVLPCDPAALDAELVFSALDATAAGEVEPAFARAGRMVLSNAKNYRMEADVPLRHPRGEPAPPRACSPAQRDRRGWTGRDRHQRELRLHSVAAMVAGAAARAVRRAAVFMATMQAVSGAGYPGVPVLDILGNVIPFIRRRGAEDRERDATRCSAT